LVFVHGFAGHPGRTWRKIQDFLTEDWWQESDLFFFGYASVKEPIQSTAARLAKLLRRLLEDPPDDLFADPRLRRSGTEYEELTLVGHSQGGLVVRQAVLDALWDVCQGGKPGPLESSVAAARLRLFAPAILGAQVSGLKGIILHSIGPGTFIRILTHGSPSYLDLQPKSALLESVRRSTESFSKTHTHISAFKASVAWADRESVVATGPPWLCDPAAITIPGTDHQTVCKAKGSDDAVMTFVERS
jgi:pimeloyl-ACP methyl ester carboxylesterase